MTRCGLVSGRWNNSAKEQSENWPVEGQTVKTKELRVKTFVLFIQGVGEGAYEADAVLAKSLQMGAGR